MKYISLRLFAYMFAVVTLTGCVKDDPDPDDPGGEEPKNEAPALTQKVNSFIRDVMTDVYLWYDKMPTIDIRYENDSKAYFKKLLFTDDKWSYITDDIVTFEQSLEGIEKSYGYSLAFGRYVDENNIPTGNYFAIVEYVYPNTPASVAGFKRGDIITRLNGGSITSGNYKELLNGASITVTKGKYDVKTGITVTGELSMQSDTLTLDPVLMKKVIETGGKKIGYLLYMQYISSYNNTSLKEALQYFKENQITDLVLDLRYNPGGQTTAAQYLCSSLAPENIVNANSQLVSFQWNDKYQAYWVSRNNQDQLGVKFNSTVPVKLNLNKIFILTGNGSASASELTIVGLEPYMDIVQIGDTTYGKYTASITLKPEDWYENASQYSDFKNWGIQPIVIRFANALGVTNFKNGFAPDYLVTDKLMPAYPLGELSEPLLSKAVEKITGVIAMKKAEVPDRFKLYDRGFSRFDPQKRNLFLDQPGDFLKTAVN